MAEVRTLLDRVVAEILDLGPMGFDRFVELALYDQDHGFYSAGGQAGGRQGDFVTSVETGPLFAALVGDWLDEQWRAAGEPDEFRVAEVGAGTGTLFRGINRSQPACFGPLIYTLVEQSASLRDQHDALPGENWRSSHELPNEHQHTIVANELLDNLAFGIAERTASAWELLAVSADLSVATTGDQVELPAAVLDSLRDVGPGTRIPVATQAIRWVTEAQRRCDRLLVFDYGAPTAELADRDMAGWLRTYRGHVRGSDPFVAIGEQDITHDVPFDQLPNAAVNLSQADWLSERGIAERVSSARETWQARAHIGDLEAMVARSAVNEAAALTDPNGLGAFRAVEWSPPTHIQDLPVHDL